MNSWPRGKALRACEILSDIFFLFKGVIYQYTSKAA